MSEKSKKAVENFSDGYNCAQAVVSVFQEEESCNDLIKVCSCFGGGIGGKRQVCGAVSAMCMIAGVKKGYDTPEKGEKKLLHTKFTSDICDQFIEKSGSMICGELLGLDGFCETAKNPKLSCSQLVELAVEIVEKI